MSWHRPGSVLGGFVGGRGALLDPSWDFDDLVGLEHFRVPVFASLTFDIVEHRL